MEEASSSNTVLLIFLFIVLFFICLDLLSPKKTYSEKTVNSNKEHDEELRKKEEFNRLQKRLRAVLDELERHLGMRERKVPDKARDGRGFRAVALHKL